MFLQRSVSLLLDIHEKVTRGFERVLHDIPPVIKMLLAGT